MNFFLCWWLLGIGGGIGGVKGVTESKKREKANKKGIRVGGEVGNVRGKDRTKEEEFFGVNGFENEFFVSCSIEKTIRRGKGGKEKGEGGKGKGGKKEVREEKGVEMREKRTCHFSQLRTSI